ncbi:Integrase core domain protein [Enhygromyxa salina]|uniref:Integrase core domain protein n=2 Tax=Enhygromyxa salina TaxID=215803 RepID=A0A2S9YKD7_9BACT|nr:Integrase core domain protein [Enhygromyxa salina]
MRRIREVLRLEHELEYREASVHDPQKRRPYQYAQFCERHGKFRGQVDASMHQEHRAGEKVFVDYSGMKPTIADRETGEVIEVELYVAVLGASNYTYAEATLTQQRDVFIASTARAFEYFDGVPAITVPDRLRSAVSGPDRIDPEINPGFAEFAEHYSTAVIPTRARKPKDKAKVETGVKIAQSWILARLRNITFFSLDDLNVAIDKLLEALNDKPFQKLEGCRRSAYEELDKPALRPLPPRRFEPSNWKTAKVHIDHHVEFDHRYYSAPHHLIGTKVWVRATVNSVELLLDGRRIASHKRSYGRKGTLSPMRPIVPSRIVSTARGHLSE